MNNLAPNKWLVFMQWAVAVQWLKLAAGVFSSGHFADTVRSGSGTVRLSALVPGYGQFLPSAPAHYAQSITDISLYGGTLIGAVLILAGVWTLVHKPVGLWIVNTTLIALLTGAGLVLILQMVVSALAPGLDNALFLLGLLQLILALYYLAFRRHKKRHQGTNLQYAIRRDIT